jgi:glycolate oxidase
LKQSGAREVRQARTNDESEALWEARRNVSPAVARLGRNKVSEDITVPRSKVPEMVTRLQEIGRKHDLRVVVFGHIGDGNLHPTVFCDRRDPGIMQRVEKAAGDILDASVEFGGTLSGEHGIGIFKRSHMERALDPEALARMLAVKRVFDPNGIMNPGKKLPG